MGGQYIAGRNPILEILKTDKEVEKIYVLNGELKGSINKIIGIAGDRKIPIQHVDRNKLDSLSNGNVHQGVVASVTSYEYVDIDDILDKAKHQGEEAFILILDEIEDPHNLGAIIRTAECAGVHGVIIPKRRPAPINSTVYTSSAGAVEHMLVSKVTNISHVIGELKDKGLWIYGADMAGDNYYETSLDGPIGLVIGSEGKGISRLVKENCDVLVKIPMVGKISSLNASNAASILMYEVLKQRNEKQ